MRSASFFDFRIVRAVWNLNVEFAGTAGRIGVEPLAEFTVRFTVRRGLEGLQRNPLGHLQMAAIPPHPVLPLNALPPLLICISSDT